MTHSLHRLGTLEERKNDYVVLIMPSVNVKGSSPKIKKYIELALKNNAVNIGSCRFGHIYKSSIEKMIAKIQDKNSTCTATFDSKENLIAFLKDLKEADMGLPVTVSGVTEETKDICRQVGLKPHTINYSLGVWGKTEKLPDERIHMLCAMCGHAMLSSNLVKKAVEDVKKGKDPVEAAKFLARPCHCGLYNVNIAAKVLKELALEA